jgi:DNA replication licensing factor MCM6
LWQELLDKLTSSPSQPGPHYRDYLICKLNTLWSSSYTENVTLPATPGGLDMDGADAQQTELIYVEQVRAMRDYELATLYVDFSHLLERDDVLARAISDQYYRYGISSIRLKFVFTYQLDFFPISDVLSST